jgi:hypothetical protein
MQSILKKTPDKRKLFFATLCNILPDESLLEHLQAKPKT